jgi:hypothetical protein
MDAKSADNWIGTADRIEPTLFKKPRKGGASTYGLVLGKRKGRQSAPLFSSYPIRIRVLRLRVLQASGIAASVLRSGVTASDIAAVSTNLYVHSLITFGILV